MFNFKTLFVGHQLFYLSSCQSTNEVALQKLSDNPSEGALVVTDHQLAGKGQQNNSWEAAPNQNITLSIILKPAFLKASEQFRLNIAISIAVQSFLEQYLPQGVSIKWPNDIYHEDQKICGMLIQNVIQHQHIKYSIIGLGINVNQQKFRYPKATSLGLITAKEYEIKPLIEDLIYSIEGSYLSLKGGGYEKLKAIYLQKLYWYQEQHLFRDSEGKVISGAILGVDPMGRLCLASDGKTRYFSLKEIKYLK